MKNHEKEKYYEDKLPPYVSTASFQLYFINSNISEAELINLLAVVQNEMYFIMDTEADINDYTPAIIQLLVMPSNPSSSCYMLLIETCFLPNPSSTCFQLIQQLFCVVFNKENYLYSWGPLKSELQKFERYQLFTSSIFAHLIDVQAVFTKWFDAFLMEQMESDDVKNNNDDFVVVRAPPSMFELYFSSSEINRIKITNNQLWSLQDGLAYTLHKYLSKRDTCRSWAIGLDEKLTNCNKKYSSLYRHRLIKYSTYDCLSLMDLILFMYNNFLINGPYHESQVKTLGKYFSFLKNKFTAPLPSSIGKQQSTLSALIFSDTDDDSDDMLTVHELNEQQLSSLHPLVGQRLTTADPTLIPTTITTTTTTTTLFPSTPPYPLAPDYNQYFLSSVLSVEPEASRDLAPVLYEFHQDNEISNENPDIHQEIEVLEQSSNIQSSIKRKKSRSRRSQAAKLLRNQQSSIRHRRNRYIYEVIRDINCSVSDAKCILQCYDMKYLNINPVGSKLYIGIKNEQLQQYYDQLLPVNVFL
ncbi:unnamed protein product [Adineta steineri]|uniref:Uncharacterized protein n=2 Tax=Adineta steineri TaxID=433720 RepID=A0A815QX19_9BILA|nr:unnamed protein product [Adineta steineri]